ncbi:adult enhancer factor 1-like [Hylaeus volcanicus]|uniref:adult enhancer factor 1-like n=1 Tax=Hylaeus volcanicus TaxID=313075 RepID=UPI0023B7F058|nr:adult enhancer factor 1-like [Hylaeus volcanicus]
MLHSSLPRAFLAPGLNYLGYYGDEVLQYPYGSPSWHIPMESTSTYPRVSDHHVLQTWDVSKSSTPCPLDLSLKPPPTPTTPKVEEQPRPEPKKSHRNLEEINNDSENLTYVRNTEEAGSLVVDEFDSVPRSSSVHSHSSYEQLLAKNDALQLQDSPEKLCVLDEGTRLVPFASTGYTHSQKLALVSPENYHHQLLLTPQHHLQSMHAPMTPPSTPSPPQCPRRKIREEDASPVTSSNATLANGLRAGSSDKLLQRPKKKHARRLKFDEDTSSPVSGTVILGPDEAVVTGDIDPAFNIVEVTEEARAELAKIENRLGPYQCKLCRQLHEDAFQLAQHRCSRIAHVEYRCPECDKRFSCPANLASHRRWHKPRLTNGEHSSSANAIEIPCTRCDAKFTRQAALRKHLANQHPETNNNVLMDGQGGMIKHDVARMGSEGALNTEVP